MAIKLIKFIFVILVSFVLFGCPGEIDQDNCDQPFKTSNVDGLVVINPLKNLYNVGDLVIYKAVIPNSNTFFGNEINMKQSTFLDKAILSTNFPFLYSENNFTFVKGSKFEENNYNMQYISSSNTFELEIIIELTKPGSYTIYNSNVLYNSAGFSLGNGYNCSAFFIGTNIQGIDKTQPYQITVQ